MTRGARSQQLSRRDAMRLLGAGTAGFVAACGGPGYAKTVTQFAPMLREAGLDEATVQSFIADNPRRWLAFTPAKWPVSYIRRIRPPMHPAPRRSSSVEYCRYAPSSRQGGPCATSIATPSVRGRIYDTDHKGRVKDSAPTA